MTDLETELSYPNNSDVPESYRAEQLFQFFKNTKAATLDQSDSSAFEAAIGIEWCSFVSKTLYKEYYKTGVADPDGYRQAVKHHPYLNKLAALASASLPLVITHNFDDAFETALDLDPLSQTKKENRRYNTFWKPQPFLRREFVNIYHPNGYRPFDPAHRASEKIILTEGNFADHLANTHSVEAHFLLSHLADRTCLIVGHSLSDGTLKNALRMHATQRPGHVNYYVHWHTRGAAGLSSAQQTAIREANFETYNLITIFANSDEIAELLRLVNMDDRELMREFAGTGCEPRHVYYLSGAVSSGKSTVLGHLRDLVTIEEWPDRMPAEMNQQSLGLPKPKQQMIDEKLEEGIWKKNDEADDVQVGIVVVDRAPLDFLAFPVEPDEKIADTANARKQTVLPRFVDANFLNFCPGEVIFISTDEVVLFERQIQRGRTTLGTSESNQKYIAYLKNQQDLMTRVYLSGSGNGSVIQTDPCSIGASVKRVARIIHFNDYKSFPFATRLGELEGGAE